MANLLDKAPGNTSLLHTTFWASVGVQTIGEVSAKDGKTMPTPRVYGAIFVLWFLLGLIAEAGREPARIAGALSVVVFLTLLIGKAGQKSTAGGNKVLKWLGDMGKLFSGVGSEGSGSGSSSGPTSENSGGIPA